MERTLTGKVAVVTGAGSGIGRALARVWSAKGAAVALSDRSEAALAETAAELAGPCLTRVVDVADPAAIEAWAESIDAAHGRVDVLVNNAGVSLTGPFEEVSAEDFDWLFRINWWGVYHGTRTFLPRLARAGTPADPSHLVNLSSIFGVVGVPGQTAYCAAKFAVRGFTEALAAELVAFLSGQFDDDTPDRVKFMHTFSWKRVLSAQKPD